MGGWPGLWGLLWDRLIGEIMIQCSWKNHPEGQNHTKLLRREYDRMAYWVIIKKSTVQNEIHRSKVIAGNKNTLRNHICNKGKSKEKVYQQCRGEEKLVKVYTNHAEVFNFFALSSILTKIFTILTGLK